MKRLIAAFLLATFSLNASALSVLLNGSHPDRGVGGRLESLGHTVTASYANTWDSNWDYSAYDVVAFQYGSQNPADIANLLTAVQNEEVGVVFFRGSGAELTAAALGVNYGLMDWQYANTMNIIDNSHYITQGIDLGVYDLGQTYMSEYYGPGPDTTVLATGADGAGLLVHNDYRIAMSHYYGHESGYDLETEFSMELTERTLQWAAGAAVVPIPAAAWLFGSALMGLGWVRRKQTV